MKKHYYRLMAKGFRELINRDGNKIRWNVPHYSKLKYVMAKDEELARFEIRNMLSDKWIGFRIFRKRRN